MGRPKATIEVDGTAMLDRAVAALRAGGVEHVLVVGGERAWADTADGWLADRWPGEGPLGGLVTGLGHLATDHSDESIVVLAACDQPWLDGPAVRALVAALHDASALDGVTTHDRSGRRPPFPSAHRLRVAPIASRRFTAGERRADAVFGEALGEVALDHAVLRDVDTPADLPPSP